MKEFVAPDLLNIEDVGEGVYAGSGAWNDNQETPIPPIEDQQTCWINWRFEWTGHNNGGHSVCHVSANHCGDHSGNRLVINIVTNFPIEDVQNASGCTITNKGTHSFTLIRNNFFNANDNIGFNFEIKTSAIYYDESGNPLHGAIGAYNKDAYYCRLASYECS